MSDDMMEKVSTAPIAVRLHERAELELRRLAEERGDMKVAAYCRWVLERHVDDIVAIKAARAARDKQNRSDDE